MTVSLSRTDDEREVTLVCPHGATHLPDPLPSVWSDADHLEQATTYHQLDYPACRCFDPADDAEEDDGLDHERPRIFPPLAVQLAALRLMSAARAGELDVADRGLVIDGRLVTWFKQECDRAD